MKIKFPLPVFLFIFFLSLFPASRSRAADPDFRLIFIGSLSGYVKLCG
ncbi:MAG: hypothetical protein GXO34_08355 [Deltaproteobacteria bacterium]|nr:hypothetical protein [Deltaproteobacteria bacterium]